jgi:prepilin-type processing-associated H-X9-DG protein
MEKAWVVQLAKDYGHQQKIARCPSDRSPHWATPLPDGRIRRTSYASNSYTVYEIGSQPPYNRFGLIKRPAATIFWVELAEKGDFAGADHVHAEDWWFGDSAKLAAREMEIHQHLDTKANYAFMDSHVEPLRFDRTYRIDASRGFPPSFFVNKYDPKLAQ